MSPADFQAVMNSVKEKKGALGAQPKLVQNSRETVNSLNSWKTEPRSGTYLQRGIVWFRESRGNYVRFERGAGIR